MRTIKVRDQRSVEFKYTEEMIIKDQMKQLGLERAVSEVARVEQKYLAQVFVNEHIEVTPQQRYAPRLKFYGLEEKERELCDAISAAKVMLANLKSNNAGIKPAIKLGINALVDRHLEKLNNLQLNTTDPLLSPSEMVQDAIDYVSRITILPDRLHSAAADIAHKQHVLLQTEPGMVQSFAAANKTNADLLAKKDRGFLLRRELHARFTLQYQRVLAAENNYCAKMTEIDHLNAQFADLLTSENFVYDDALVKTRAIETALAAAADMQNQVMLEHDKLLPVVADIEKENTNVLKLCAMYVETIMRTDFWSEQVKAFGGIKVYVNGVSARVPTAIGEMILELQSNRYANWESNPTQAFKLMSKFQEIATHRLQERPDDSCSFFARRREPTSVAYKGLMEMNLAQFISDAVITQQQKSLAGCNIPARNNQLRPALAKMNSGSR